MIKNEYLFNATDQLEEEFYNIECYINELNNATTLRKKAFCYFDIGHAYYRLFGNENPTAWLPWLLKCQDGLLQAVEKDKNKVSHLLTKVTNEISIYFIDVCNNPERALQIANEALEYTSKKVLDDHHFVPLNLSVTYRIIGECHEKLGDKHTALINYGIERSIIEGLMLDGFMDIDYKKILSEIDSKILPLREN